MFFLFISWDLLLTISITCNIKHISNYCYLCILQRYSNIIKAYFGLFQVTKNAAYLCVPVAMYYRMNTLIYTDSFYRCALSIMLFYVTYKEFLVTISLMKKYHFAFYSCDTAFMEFNLKQINPLWWCSNLNVTEKFKGSYLEKQLWWKLYSRKNILYNV